MKIRGEYFSSLTLACTGWCLQAQLTQAMLTVGSASQLEFCTRAAGVEVLLTLSERAPAIMRKCSTVAPGLMPLVLSLACEVSFCEVELGVTCLGILYNRRHGSYFASWGHLSDLQRALGCTYMTTCVELKLMSEVDHPALMIRLSCLFFDRTADE